MQSGVRLTYKFFWATFCRKDVVAYSTVVGHKSDGVGVWCGWHASYQCGMSIPPTTRIIQHSEPQNCPFDSIESLGDR